MSEIEFLKLGLRYANYPFPNRCKIDTNISRFKNHYGVHPLTCENMWSDFQNTPNQDARIKADTKPVFLLIGLRFLWTYDTEEILGSFFGLSAKTVRKYYKECTEKIYLLLPELLTPIEDLNNDDGVFILSIDGTHCPIEEPRPWSRKWSSHKLGKKAGVAYEVALRIQKDELAWVHGPFPAGDNDIEIFRNKLKGKLQSLNSTLTIKKRVSHIVFIIIIEPLMNKLYTSINAHHIISFRLLLTRATVVSLN